MNFLPTIGHSLRIIGLGSIAIAFSANGVAQSTLKPGDMSLRHHLQLLEETGAVDTLSTTWPLSVDGLSASISNLDRADLDPEQQRSLNYLHNQLGDRTQQSLSLRYGNNSQRLRGFSEDYRERGEIRFEAGEQFGSITFHLQAAVIDNPLDDNNVRLDGSYLSLNLGNWQLGAGSIDRWWGPGCQTSNILSNNARPSPGLFINRNKAEAFDLPILRSLGRWTLSAFANQLESDRHVPKAKLFGGRFAFEPTRSLEIGLFRTAQWGGEGRPESLSNLLDLILGNDNVGDDGLALDGSNEPGNQLGGIDIRWTRKLLDHPVTFYGQLVGEDEAGGLPSRKIGAFGVETPLITESSHGRIYLEASDTTMDFLDDRFANSTYNHHIYQTGYRYRGQAIGASTDNDSRLVTLGGFHEIGSKDNIRWKAQYASLNRDDSPGRNSVTHSHLQTGILHVGYDRELSERLSVTLNATHLMNDIPADSVLSRSTIQLGINVVN